MTKKHIKNHIWGPKLIFGQFFGHNFFIWNRFELGFSPLFLEYFSWFLRIFAEFFDEFYFFTFLVKMPLKNGLAPKQKMQKNVSKIRFSYSTYIDPWKNHSGEIFWCILLFSLHPTVCVTFFTLTSTAKCSAICHLLFFDLKTYFALKFHMVQFFWPSGQKTLFSKGTFCNFLPFLGLTSNAIFSVICPCRMVFNIILENYKEKYFQKWFWILSHIFGSGHKMHFKKTIFAIFATFLAEF